MIAEISLADQRAATVLLNEQRKRLGIEVLDLEDKSGVSASAFFAWKSTARRPDNARSPSFLSLVAIAETLGYEPIMRSDHGVEHRVPSAKAAMRYLNAERRLRKWTIARCEADSGVSASTFFSLASGKRDTRVDTMVAIAALFWVRTSSAN